MRWRVTAGAALSCVALAGLAREAVGGVSVGLTVRETAGAARHREPVTTGVPFARGALRQTGGLRLLDAEGKAVLADVHVLSPWPDGSVRTALVTFLADLPPGGQASFTLTDGSTLPAAQPPRAIKITRNDDAIELNTGPMRLRVSRRRSSLIDTLEIDGQPVLRSGPGAVIVTRDGRRVELARSAPTSVALEHAGDVAATVLVKGRVGNLHKGLLGYTARITAYAGKKIVRLRFWLENDGAFGFKFGRGNFNAETAEWFIFDGLFLRLPLAGRGPTVVRMADRTVRLGAGEQFAVEQRCDGGRWENFRYVIKKDAKEVSAGARIDGLLNVACAGGPNLNLAVRHFWQNYEKAITVKDGRVDVHLWPTFGDWPRSAGTPGLAPPPGREVGTRVPGMYAFVGAMHKGYELLLDFGVAAERTDLAASAATMNRPLMALASGDYCAGTGAWGNFAPNDFVPQNETCAAAVTRWRTWARNVVARKAKRNLQFIRQDNRFGPGYGWMDFGDLFWVCGVSNLHYDWNWTMTLNAILTGGPEFLDAATEMTRHRMDVAQVWSDRDAENFDYLVRYEKGCTDLRYPFYQTDEGTPQPQHNWIRGLVLYYWLTGDVKAREAAYVNASIGIKRRLVDWFAKRPSPRGAPRASGWSILNLCAAYDMTGEQRFLDWAKILWNNHLKLAWEEVMAKRIRLTPLQWYYSTDGLVTLHQRTGDPALIRQMKDFCHLARDPKNWQYTPDMAMFMTNYAGYLSACGDAECVSDAYDWFDTGIPRDPRRLVLFGGGGAYTKETGKALRNGHIFLWSQWQRRRRRPVGPSRSSAGGT